MEQQQLKRLKELEEENNRLKQMYADVSLDKCFSDFVNIPKPLNISLSAYLL